MLAISKGQLWIWVKWSSFFSILGLLTTWINISKADKLPLVQNYRLRPSVCDSIFKWIIVRSWGFPRMKTNYCDWKEIYDLGETFTRNSSHENWKLSMFTILMSFFANEKRLLALNNSLSITDTSPMSSRLSSSNFLHACRMTLTRKRPIRNIRYFHSFRDGNFQSLLAWRLNFGFNFLSNRKKKRIIPHDFECFMCYTNRKLTQKMFLPIYTNVRADCNYESEKS